MACANGLASCATRKLLGCLFALLLCFVSNAKAQTAPRPLNLNTATVADLETLPGIGPGLAGRILEYRGKHGPFKRPQDLIILRGMSAKRFRLLATLVCV